MVKISKRTTFVYNNPCTATYACINIYDYDGNKITKEDLTEEELNNEELEDLKNKEKDKKISLYKIKVTD